MDGPHISSRMDGIARGTQLLADADRSVENWWTEGVHLIVSGATEECRSVEATEILLAAVTQLITLLRFPGARTHALQALVTFCTRQRGTTTHVLCCHVANEPGGVEALLTVMDGPATSDDIAGSTCVLAQSLLRAGYRAISELPDPLVCRIAYTLNSVLCDATAQVIGTTTIQADTTQRHVYRLLVLIGAHPRVTSEFSSMNVAVRAVHTVRTSLCCATRCAAIAFLGLCFSCGEDVVARAASTAGVPEKLTHRMDKATGREAFGLAALLRAAVQHSCR